MSGPGFNTECVTLGGEKAQPKPLGYITLKVDPAPFKWSVDVWDKCQVDLFGCSKGCVSTSIPVLENKSHRGIAVSSAVRLIYGIAWPATSANIWCRYESAAIDLRGKTPQALHDAIASVLDRHDRRMAFIGRHDENVFSHYVWFTNERASFRVQFWADFHDRDGFRQNGTVYLHALNGHPRAWGAKENAWLPQDAHDFYVGWVREQAGVPDDFKIKLKLHRGRI